LFKAVGARVCIGSKVTVGQVSNRLGGSAEIGRRFDPTHREGERKANELRFARSDREDNAKLGNVVWEEPNTVKAVGNIDLGEVDTAKARVGMHDLGEEAVKGAAKLHGVLRAKLSSVLVDIVESVVRDGARSAVVLGYDAQGAEPQLLELSHQRSG
jgi:hypothetical protein